MQTPPRLLPPSYFPIAYRSTIRKLLASELFQSKAATMGSGCGTVGSAIASGTKDPRSNPNIGKKLSVN